MWGGGEEPVKLMQIVRTVVWVLLLVALLIFSIANWGPVVTVRIWEGLVVDTKIPAIVVISFLIGFVPMWIYERAHSWRLKRRIHSLEVNLQTLQAGQAPAAGEAEHERLEQDRLARERPSGTLAREPYPSSSTPPPPPAPPL